MPAPHILTHAIALGSESRGESHIAYRLLSLERGPLIALARRKRRAGQSPVLDLFDEGEFQLEIEAHRNSGFIKDVQVARKRLGLARSFTAFKTAARFANTLLANPVHEESLPSVFDILAKGLDAWEQGHPPLATYLKCLYLYSRLEGCPIKEDWARRLPEDELQIVVSILNRPLREVQVEEADLKRSIQSLENYIQGHTHIRLGSYS